ncbi:MAG: leucine-rich repeat domain-containing protein [Ruminococcus sp.]|nr:leucine-rich repeat domain-containing protein [Ruminococcus sp.]
MKKVKSRFKKIIAVILSATMLLSVSSTAISVTAAEINTASSVSETSGDFEYEVLDDGTVEITKYTGSATEFEIPSEIDGKKVTSIGSSAFYNCTSLENIIIPDSVTSIEDFAFAYCSSLKSATIPDSVTWFFYAVFSNCTSLENIIIPDSVTRIFKYTFDNCTSLKNITIPDSVTSIDEYTFRDCTSLENITIPDSVTRIDKYTFDNCTSLKNITIPDSITNIDDCAFYNCTSLESVAIPDGVTSIGKSAFRYCTSLENITIPDSVIRMSYDAFLGCCNLESIEVEDSNEFYCSVDGVLFSDDKKTLLTYPAGKDAEIYAVFDGVTSIGRFAFGECTNLENITMPDSVTSIGDHAFFKCLKLTSVIIPDGVISIGNDTFSGCCTLKDIVIHDNVTSIGAHAFNECTSLENITIPDSVTYIGYYAFSDCSNLASIYLPNSEISIYHYAFQNCTALEMIKIPEQANLLYEGIDGAFPQFEGCVNLKNIEIAQENSKHSSIDGVIFNKEKTKLLFCPEGKSGDYTIPDGVGRICAFAFSNCKNITNIIIPDSVYQIDGYAFKNCTGITSISIPESVNTIGYYGGWYDNNIFTNCTNLKTLKVAENNNYYSTIDNVLYNNNKTELIYCSSGKYGDFAVPETVTSLTAYAFDEAVNITSLTLHKDIPYSAFNSYVDLNGCINLEVINVAEDNEQYFSFDGVLYNKDKTELICCPMNKSGICNIFNGVLSIDRSEFYGRTKLTKIIIPESVTQIGGEAFYRCTSLKDIVVDDDNANFSSEDGVLFDKNKTIIKYYPAAKTETNYTVPDTVTSIGDYAFGDCTSLESITIPDSVKDIESFSLGYRLGTTKWEYMKIDGFTIYGYKNTAAEAYATENGFTFIALDEEDKNDDINNDGNVDVNDVTVLQMHLANYDIEVNAQALDVNNDDNVDVTDVTTLQMILAGYDI